MALLRFGGAVIPVMPMVLVTGEDEAVRWKTLMLSMCDYNVAPQGGVTQSLPPSPPPVYKGPEEEHTAQSP